MRLEAFVPKQRPPSFFTTEVKTRESNACFSLYASKTFPILKQFDRF